MPIEYTVLASRPEVLASCPQCGASPFESAFRGMVQRAKVTWLLRRHQAYCSIICATCDTIIGYEHPSAPQLLEITPVQRKPLSALPLKQQLDAELLQLEANVLQLQEDMAEDADVIPAMAEPAKEPPSKETSTTPRHKNVTRWEKIEQLTSKEPTQDRTT
jgi:hypothetical protein